MGENFKTLCEGAYYEDAEGRKYGPVRQGDEGAYECVAKDRFGKERCFNEEGKHWSHRSMDLVRVLPDEDGWYPHVPGDPLPVGGDVVVEVEFRSAHRPNPSAACTWCWWTGTYKSFDIVKYRIVNEQKSPQASGPGDQAQPAVMSVHDTPADAPSGGALSLCPFKTVDVVGAGFEGYCNLFIGDYPIALVPPGPATSVKEAIAAWGKNEEEELFAIHAVLALPGAAQRRVVEYLKGRIER